VKRVESDGAEGGDDILADEPAAVREELRRLLKTQGVKAAYSAMLDICRNKTAPAPARATAAATIFRSAGWLGRRADEDELDDKPLELMSAGELEQVKNKHLARMRRLAREIAEEESNTAGGVFD